MTSPTHTNGSKLSRLEADMVPVSKDDGETSTDLVGYTMFDQPGSEDGTITALIRSDRIPHVPAQSLVRIESKSDKRNYLGVVSAGPYAIPDSLRPDSHVLIAVGTNGAEYLPPYHGRVQITLLGERLEDSKVIPARWRPTPQSAVYRLSAEESTKALQSEGDIRLGTAIGMDDLVVRISSKEKSILPRHLAILGTTGGGKSTTVAGLVSKARQAGMAVILLDVEGEYTRLHEPNDEPGQVTRLRELGFAPEGIPTGSSYLYHLAHRETTNPGHPNRKAFSLQFARLSPYTVMELLGLNDAQADRFLYAYEISKSLLRELGIFPEKDKSREEQERQERILRSLDEFERGYPRLTLSMFLDVVNFCKAKVTKTTLSLYNEKLKTDQAKEFFNNIDLKDMPTNAASWGKLNSLLWRMHKLKVFCGPTVKASPMSYTELLKPGRLSVIDLSDAGMSALTNIAVSDVLRGIQEEQDKAYRTAEEGKGSPPPSVLIVIEEAHEFLSEERIDNTPILFQQVARIAKRGRKRRLGLCFVTQLPQHLPKQVMGLCNSFILHKLTDPYVIASLKKTVGSVDEGLWTRLPSLAPGQAVVSFPHLTRPLLTAIDPAGCKLRMVD